jgi:hypothetical protein
MLRKRRRWRHDSDVDPLGGLVNLFDVWIVVVVALALALLHTHTHYAQLAAQAPSDSPPEPGAQIDLVKLPRFRKTESALTGKGERLGTAYRLENGEVVYVPE